MTYSSRFRIALTGLILSRALAPAADACCDWPDLHDRHAAYEERPFRLGVTYGYTRMDRLQTGTRSISQFQARQSYDMRPTEMTTRRVEARASYVISPAYELRLTMPWVRNTMSMQNFMSDHSVCGDIGYYISDTQGNGYPHKMAAVEGWGDLVLEASLRLLDAGEAESGIHRLYLRPGLKTPTGDYKVTASGKHTIRTPWGPHTMQHGGGYADPCMQPGTGSWDPLLQIDYQWQLDRVAVLTSGGYQRTTRNSLGYEYGDAATLGVYPSYQILRWLSLTTGVRYRHVAQSKDPSGRYTDWKDLTKVPANSGGEYADVLLSLAVIPTPGCVLSFGVSLPLWSDLNGIQMAPGELFTCGVSAAF